MMTTLTTGRENNGMSAMTPTETAEAETETIAQEEKPKGKAEESKKDYLEMSDEDFLKINGPEKSEKPVPEKVAGDDKADESEDSKVDKKEQDTNTKDETKATDDKPEEPKEEKKAKSDSPGSKVVVAESEDKKPKTDTVDYEGFFKQIMTPFKANGKTFEVKTPEEAIRLMQKGAGYGRKIQDMQPHLKVLRMLEKNNLLDESKLSFLIDLNQKNPDAIKKLIKDGGIDPLDLNADDKVNYTPKSHAVTDKEVAFHQAVAEIQTQPGGFETLRQINQTWDQESKGLLWESPEIFEIIQTQRDNGVYNQIVAEIDRQKLLGTMPNSTPFLQAYKVAGDHLVKTNGFKAPIQNQPVTNANGSGNGQQQPQVIATRTAVPKSQAQNSDKAAAASSTKTSTSKPNLAVNPLEMSDDDFMKQFKGRF